MAKNIGKIVQVIGPVVDIRYAAGQLPALNNAIVVEKGEGQRITVEVAQHIGDDVVRCIAMASTDGLVRGMDCLDTEAPISVPVGQQVLDRMCRQELARAVQRLEEKYRSPVILMYRFGMGIDEIARIERVPKGTIKSRLSRARKQLRKEMEERGYAQEF